MNGSFWKAGILDDTRLPAPNFKVSCLCHVVAQQVQERWAPSAVAKDFESPFLTAASGHMYCSKY